MKKFILVYLVAVSAVVSAQNKSKPQDNNEIVGIWKNYQQGGEMTIILNENGTGEIQVELVKYRANDGKLFMTMGAQTVITYTYAVSGNTLRITGGDMGAAMVFNRSSSADSHIPNAKRPKWIDKALLGKWTGEKEYFEVNADGTCSYNGAPITYKITKKTIVIASKQSTMLIPYDVSDSLLTLTINGAQFAYTRPAKQTGQQ